MNIFFTNPNPHIAANEHCNVHQTKMIVEYSQLLSTAHQLLGTCLATKAAVYKTTHQDHPSAKWVRESVDHYSWLYQCLVQLHKLYSDRTGKIHKSHGILHWLKHPPAKLACNGWTVPPVAAPDDFKDIGRSHGAHIGYRYYLCHKFDEWQSRTKPIPVEWTCSPPIWWRKHTLKNKRAKVYT